MTCIKSQTSLKMGLIGSALEVMSPSLSRLLGTLYRSSFQLNQYQTFLDGRPQSRGRTWQAWGGSFLLLPRRHALSSRWLWTFNHNACENRLEEVQGPATSSLFKPPLFQNTWLCIQLLCAERNAPCQRDLAIGYSLDIMRQTACLVVNPIIVDGYASFFHCTMAVRASDSMTASS